MNIEINVKSGRLEYELSIDTMDKITVIRGMSGTGKSTLCNMIENCNKEVEEYEIVCDRRCVVITDAENIMSTLMSNKGAIIFIDEDEIDCIYKNGCNGKQLNSIIRDADNYFVLITRRQIKNLHLVINAVLELESTHKDNDRYVNKFTRVYKDKNIDMTRR